MGEGGALDDKDDDDDDDDWIVDDAEVVDDSIVSCICGATDDVPKYQGLWVRCENELCHVSSQPLL